MPSRVIGDDVFEIVWNGGEMLPDYESHGSSIGGCEKWADPDITEASLSPSMDPQKAIQYVQKKNLIRATLHAAQMRAYKRRAKADK